jgi:hypothetical protein
MKRSRCIMLGLTVLLMLVLLAVLAGPASANATKTSFSSTQTIDLASVNHGEFVLAGATAHIRGDSWLSSDDSSDSRLNGTTELYIHDVTASPVWVVGHGTYRTVLAGGLGVWEGTWTIKEIYATDTEPDLRYWKGEGRGVSGAVAGLLVKWTAVSSFMDPIMQTGYIIEK